MLKKHQAKRIEPTGGRFAIVASKYNAEYVDAMVAAAQRVLKQGRAEEVKIVRVPGAYEIPVVVARLAQSAPSFSAIICLGVILRGATVHAQSISDVVSFALGTIALQHELPVIHEVLLLENEEQARERCLGRRNNRGTEAAETAVEMAQLLKSL